MEPRRILWRARGMVASLAAFLSIATATAVSVMTPSPAPVYAAMVAAVEVPARGRVTVDVVSGRAADGTEAVLQPWALPVL
jgi:hypothetical protein